MQKETKNLKNNQFKVIVLIYLRIAFFLLIFPFAFFFLYNDTNYLKGALLGIILAIGLIYLNIARANYIVNNYQSFNNRKWWLRLLSIFVFLVLFGIFYVVITFWQIKGFVTLAVFMIIQKFAYYYWFYKVRKVKK